MKKATIAIAAFLPIVKPKNCQTVNLYYYYMQLFGKSQSYYEKNFYIYLKFFKYMTETVKYFVV